MLILSHPFRLEPNGSVATVEDGTSEAHAEGIAILCLTRKGERDLVPSFGITDPAYGALDVAELNVALGDFGPDVTVTDVTVTYPNDRTERVAFAFTEE